MVIRPRAVAALILPLLAAPSAVWGFDEGATQRLYAALMKDESELDFPDRAVDLEAVRQALADGADPDALVLEGSGRLATPQALAASPLGIAATPLGIAASRRDAGAIRILLEHKAAVNGDKNGRAGSTRYTALHCAIMPFLYSGAPVSGSAGFPCRAESARAVLVVGALLKGGADIEARNHLGQTPLMLAMLAGEPGVTRELLEWGANPDLKDGQGKTAAQLMPLYLKGGWDSRRGRKTDPDARFEDLRWAAGRQEILALHHWHRCRPEAEAAVSAGIAPSWPAPLAMLIADYLFGEKSRAWAGAASRTAPRLEHKGEADRPEAVDWPLMSELDANLVAAVCRGFDQDRGQEVEALLAQGADINVRFNHGATPFMLLASSRRPAPTLARLLVSREGIDLDRFDAGKQTALMLAAKVGNPGMVKLLLAQGADPSLVDSYGNTALMLTEKGSEERQVLEAWAGQERPKGAAPASGVPAAGSRPESKGDSKIQPGSGIPGEGAGKAAVALAVAAGQDPRVEHKAAAPSQAQDLPGAAEDPKAALLARVNAAFARAFPRDLPGDQFELTRRLLEAGANVNVALAGGATPLMLVAGRDKVPERMASLLLSHDQLLVDLRDDEGRTALMIAAQKDHAGLVEMLLALGANPGLKAKSGESALTLAAPDSKAHQALMAGGRR